MDRERNFYLKEGLERLQNANILVVGLGGVGSFAAEFLASWSGEL
jgi:tRNA A37 threonylcarbamoyladenosine dehydratase